MTDALSLRCIYMCCKVLYFILSEDDFEIKSKIYSLKLRLVLNYILNSQDVLYFRNLFFTLKQLLSTVKSCFTNFCENAKEGPQTTLWAPKRGPQEFV